MKSVAFFMTLLICGISYAGFGITVNPKPTGGGTKPTNSYGGVDIIRPQIKPSEVKPNPNLDPNAGMNALLERLRRESENNGAVRYQGTDRAEVIFDVAPSANGFGNITTSRKRVEEFNPNEAEVLNALRKSKSLGGLWIQVPAEKLKID